MRIFNDLIRKINHHANTVKPERTEVDIDKFMNLSDILCPNMSRKSSKESKESKESSKESKESQK